MPQEKTKEATIETKSAPVSGKPVKNTLDRGFDPVKLVPGWRVQLVSVNSELAASRFADSLQSLMNADIQVLFRDNSYKIQVGNFRKRKDAETFRNRLRKSGFPDAWLVAAKVRSGARDSSKIQLRSPQIVSPDFVNALTETVFVAEAVPETVYVTIEGSKVTEAQKVVEKKPKPKPSTPKPAAPQNNYSSGPAPAGNTPGWRIQIMSLYYQPREDADAVAKNAQAQIGLATYVYSGTKSHKIRVGDFLTREDAEVALSMVRRAGYRDAFLAKSNIILAKE